MTSEPSAYEISPDGSLRIEYEETEYAMSLWVHSPRILDAQSGEILLDLCGDTRWDGSVRFGDAGEVLLNLRRYPGGAGDFPVRIDTRGRTFCFTDLPQKPEPLSDFNRRLEERFRRRVNSESLLWRFWYWLTGQKWPKAGAP